MRMKKKKKKKGGWRSKDKEHSNEMCVWGQIKLRTNIYIFNYIKVLKVRIQIFRK